MADNMYSQMAEWHAVRSILRQRRANVFWAAHRIICGHSRAVVSITSTRQCNVGTDTFGGDFLGTSSGHAPSTGPHTPGTYPTRRRIPDAHAIRSALSMVLLRFWTWRCCKATVYSFSLPFIQKYTHHVMLLIIFMHSYRLWGWRLKRNLLIFFLTFIEVRKTYKADTNMKAKCVCRLRIPSAQKLYSRHSP